MKILNVQEYPGVWDPSIEGGHGSSSRQLTTNSSYNLLLNYGPRVESKFFKFLLKQLIDSLQGVIDILYGPNYFLQDREDNMPNDEVKDDSYLNLLDLSEVRSLTEFLEGIPNQVKAAEAVTNYPIVQPTDIYRELFRRVGELVIRLISTDKFIVPGGVVLTD